MKVTAFAKVNLSLEVYAKRRDGYHGLRSVVLPISIGDELSIEPADAFSTDTGYGDSDLCLKAAWRLASVAGKPVQPVSFAVKKHIPVGGGLGGGSADAAAALLALNEFWHLRFSVPQLAQIAARVGSDVPALVLGMAFRCPVLMSGRGECVTRLRFDQLNASFLPSRHLVLANPGVFSSTAEVYANCAARQEHAREPVNDLERPAIRLHPEIGQAIARLSEAGAKGVRMSGSGSTVFGFVDSPSAAAQLVERLRAANLAAWSATPLME